MSDPLTMMTLAYGGKALGDVVQGGFKWAESKKMSQKTPAEQARLDYLKKLAKEGAIPPDQQSKLLALANRPSFNIANTSRANMMGNLTRQGLENSVVATQVGSDMDAQMARDASDRALRLSVDNEMSKMQYGDMATQYDANLSRSLMDRKYQAYGEARDAMIGGLTDYADVIGSSRFYKNNKDVFDRRFGGQ